MQRAAMHTVRGLHRSAAAAASASAAGVAAHAAAAAGLPAAASAWRVGGTTLRAFSSLRSVPSFRASSSSLPLSSGVAAAAVPAAAVRGLHCSRAALGLEEFFYRQQAGPTGRSWRVADLRTKGWHDIQRLWFVLLKERNMLLTYRHQCRVTGDRMDVVSAQQRNQDEHRLRKVRQSMSAIKHVLGERYRAYKERTDQGWVERQAVIKRQRSRVRVMLARRRSPTPQQKGRMMGLTGGLKPWQLSSRQKYARLQPRTEGQQPPQGRFPHRMTHPQEGHGQAPADLLAEKIKNEKEYV